MYLEAGADCVTTASYQASYSGFAEHGFDAAEADRFLESSVRLATEAREDFLAGAGRPAGWPTPLVAASVGPYGAFLADGSEYRGRYAVGLSDLDAFHRRRFAVLASTDADVIACETIPSREEADALLQILADSPGVWAWLSFTCRDGRSLSDGTPFVDAVRACGESERVAGVGVNCTPPRFVAELLTRARDVTELPLIAYPNSGERYDGSTKLWSGRPAGRAWAAGADDWIRAGARVLGGCCRVGPDAIAELRARVAPRSGGTQDLG
jgi:homocysteine S-methyltransferase